MKNEEPKKAAVALIERDGKILCVWNRRFQGWGLPGGKVEEGEGLIDTVRRELQEETGLYTLSLFQFYKAESSLSDGPRQVYVFRIIASGEPREMEKNCPVQWMTPEELIATSPFRDFYIKMFETFGEPAARQGAYYQGAAAAFGLMGMAEAIADNDEDRKSKPRCPECNGDLGGLYMGRLEDHRPGCARFPL